MSRGWIRRAAAGRGGIVALALIGTSLTLTLGFLLKRECLPGRYQANHQYTRNCYSDIIFLYGKRDGPFNPPDKPTPFAEHGLAYRDNNSEYPPFTGLFISSVNTAVPENDVAGFFRANALGLTVFAFAAAAAVAAVARRPRRLLYLVAAPALLSYAFHNWDLIPVGFTAVALWAFVRDRDSLSGAMLGLGAASKLFPAFIVPVLMLARKREGRQVAPLFLNSVLWFAIPSAVVLAYAGGGGWWFPFKFQGERLPNFETVWYFLFQRGQRWAPCDPGTACFWSDGGFAKSAQAMSLLIFIVGALAILFFEWRRPRFRPVAASFGIVVLALITAKVFSPQYSLWLLPFFVLVRVPWHAYAAFVVGDFVVLSAIWAYFVEFPGSQQDWHNVFLEASVYFRYAMLAYVLFWTRRGEDLTGEEPVEAPRPAGEKWVESAPLQPAFAYAGPPEREPEPEQRTEPERSKPVPLPPRPAPEPARSQDYETEPELDFFAEEESLEPFEEPEWPDEEPPEPEVTAPETVSDADEPEPFPPEPERREPPSGEPPSGEPPDAPA